MPLQVSLCLALEQLLGDCPEQLPAAVPLLLPLLAADGGAGAPVWGCCNLLAGWLREPVVQGEGRGGGREREQERCPYYL